MAMPSVVARNQIVVVDLSDEKTISISVTSNQPNTQIQDQNLASANVAPDWSIEPLVITPVVYIKQEEIPLTSDAITVTWTRRIPGLNSMAQDVNETVSDGVLTVSDNILPKNNWNRVTYICTVTYRSPDTGAVTTESKEIDFTLTRLTLEVKSVSLSGTHIFRYTSEDNVSPQTIYLTASLQNTSVSGWYYQSDNAWVQLPGADTNTTIQIAPNSDAFVNNADYAVIRVEAENGNLEDTFTIYKIRESSTVAYLSNEDITFSSDAAGQVPATTIVTNVIAYDGLEKVTPQIGTITGAPTGMTVSAGAALGNEIPITITIAGGSSLGSSGTLSIPVTYPLETTLSLNWSKFTNGGTYEADGVILSVLTPNGNTFLNGSTGLTLTAVAYNGIYNVTSSGAISWEKYISGEWTQMQETTPTILVAPSGVVGTIVYRCTFTYQGSSYKATASLMDTTDTYTASVESSRGDILFDRATTTTLMCRVYKNGEEIDEDGTACTYAWYRLDKDGNAVGSASFGTTKSINVNGDSIDEKTTFICEVTVEQDSGVSARGQIAIRDSSDVVISDTEPLSPYVDMLWLDTSESPETQKRWTGDVWEAVSLPREELSYLTNRIEEYGSQIAQMENDITLRVTKDTYEAGVNGVREWVGQNYATVDLTEDTFNVAVAKVDQYKQEVATYMRFDNSGLTLGKSDSPFKTKLDNEKLAFMEDDTEVAYVGNESLYIKETRVTDTLSVGTTVDGWFDWQMTSKGLGMKWKNPGLY